MKLAKGIILYAVFLSAISPALIFAEDRSPKEERATKVFLLGGQSNMKGQGQIENLKPPYNDAFPKVKIWQPKTKKWAPLSPEAEANKNSTFGPEISFGHAMARAWPDEDIRLVKYAAGGTALYNDWAPGEGQQYMNFMNTAKKALADLDAQETDYEIAAMLWLQGESDAAEKKGETYEKNLTTFIKHMRSEFKTPDMPFIIARVLSHFGEETGQAKLVRDAQVKVAKSMENVNWFNTDDCPIIHPERNAGHYNAAGQIQIGQRFADEYMEFYSGRKSDSP